MIHSLVEYLDRPILAQLGNPDMRTPIAHALAYPQRIDAGVAPLDLFKVARLDFEAPDFQRFPCLKLAYLALEQGGVAPAVLNAANEIAVEQFLARQISFQGIPRLIEATLAKVSPSQPSCLADVIQADTEARAVANELLTKKDFR